MGLRTGELVQSLDKKLDPSSLLLVPTQTILFSSFKRKQIYILVRLNQKSSGIEDRRHNSKVGAWSEVPYF